MSAGPDSGDAPAPERRSRTLPLQRERMQKQVFAAVMVVVAAFVALVLKGQLYGCVRCESALPAPIEGKPDLASKTEGVFVWHDGTGWHVRARAVAASRELSGVVRASGGGIEDVEAIDDASADALVIEGRRRVQFRFADPAAGAGFDFRADREACIELEVTSGDVPAPELTFLGGEATMPARLPVRLCP